MYCFGRVSLVGQLVSALSHCQMFRSENYCEDRFLCTLDTNTFWKISGGDLFHDFFIDIFIGYSCQMVVLSQLRPP